MDFRKLLDDYMKQLDCTAKDLAENSGLSAATISRYRSGDRVPEDGSENFDRLINGIVSMDNARFDVLSPMPRSVSAFQNSHNPYPGRQSLQLWLTVPYFIFLIMQFAGIGIRPLSVHKDTWYSLYAVQILSVPHHTQFPFSLASFTSSLFFSFIGPYSRTQQITFLQRFMIFLAFS